MDGKKLSVHRLCLTSVFPQQKELNDPLAF